MAIDWDDYMDEEWTDGEDDWGDDDEFSPEEIAQIKRAQQDANMGYTYTSVYIDGEHHFKCNKCGRSAPLRERPFPHKLNCPLRGMGRD